MRELLQDLRFAARLLRRTPGFTIVTVAVLALGIGANSAIFSVVNALMLEPLPYRQPDRLVVVWEHNLPRDQKSNVVSPGNYLHWREMNRVFENMAGIATFRTTLTGSGEPEEVPVQYVNGGLLSMIGIAPERGRLFTAADEAPNVNVAIIGDHLWRSRFGGDPDILNHTIQLNRVPHTVVGIMPPGFSVFAKGFSQGDGAADLWVPIGFDAAARTPRGRWMTVIARLKNGATVAQAQGDMTRVHAELTRMFPDFNTGWTARVVPLQDQMTGDVRPALIVLLAAVGFVLLIACANVANLLLARATARQRELAVRAALGADRSRLIRQLLAESLLLSLAGAAVGLVLAWWTVLGVRTAIASQLGISRLAAVSIDARVLLFTLAAAIVSGVVFGIVPALAAGSSSLVTALKEGGRSGTGARGARTRNLLVIVETALALVLLVGAGLLIRSFAAILDVNPGFDPTHTLTMKVTIPQAVYKTGDEQRAFFDRLFARFDAIPGVQTSGGTSFLPLNGAGAATGFEIVGQPKPAAGEEPVCDVRVVTHHYFRAMGVPLLRGRFYDTRDKGDNVRRVIINEAMARTYFPNTDPIGQHVIVSWNDEGPDEIIGVVGDVRQADLETEARPTVYWPPSRFTYPWTSVAIRTAGDARAVVAPAVAALHDLDPNVAAADVRTMRDILDISVAQRRLTMTILAVFAGVALLLAAVGIYGVIGYMVSQRTQEIGIRMALGAGRPSVLQMVIGQALVLALVGIAAGAAGALALTRLMSNLLFGVTPTDPLTFAAVAALLAIIAAAAAGIPAARATRVDPLTALRAE
jgi:putative ABC transport system permease protein